MYKPRIKLFIQLRFSSRTKHAQDPSTNKLSEWIIRSMLPWVIHPPMQLDGYRGYSSIYHEEDHYFPLYNVNLIAPKRTFHDCDVCACSVLGIDLLGKVGKGGSELANKLPKFFDNEHQICRSLRSGSLKGGSLTGAQTCPYQANSLRVQT